MSKSQWIIAGVAIFLVCGLYLATQDKLFGPKKINKPPVVTSQPSYTADSILLLAKKQLQPEQAARINLLEHNITRGDVKEQKLHTYHQLASFWADSAKLFAPYAHYTAEAARLENSEKSLTFAARLFLDRLKEETNDQMREWEAFQAKDLFERSLKLNPRNDSSKIGLGAVLVYGGIAMPMEGIGKIKEVADKDSTNVYAQMTMGEASLTSGQLDKALQRFARVSRLQPGNVEAIFRAAETCERMGRKKDAAGWYSKLLPYVNNVAMKKEVEARIAELNK